MFKNGSVRIYVHIKEHGLGGKGNLIGKLIDQLSVYFGNVIRDNCDSVKQM